MRMESSQGNQWARQLSLHSRRRLHVSWGCKITTYIGHSLRVTSATTLADEGASTLTLKRHGRWKSETIAETYVRESRHVLNETAAVLAGTSNASRMEHEGSCRHPAPSVVFQNCFFNGNVVFKSTDEDK